MSAEQPFFGVVGDRVHVHTARPEDIPAYRRAATCSADRIRAWNPVDPDDLQAHLSAQSTVHRTFLVRALEPVGDHDVVGRVNVTNIVRGRAWSGVLGYDSYDPYAGLGLFAEGLRLIIDIALDTPPAGMGLHRVEAAVQPGNTRSAGLLRSLGLRRRGVHPGYLWLADASGSEEWRPHVVYGVNRQEWPAASYAPNVWSRPVVAVLAGQFAAAPAARDLASHLARELQAPLVRDLGDVGAARLAESVRDALTGAVVLTGREAPDIRSLLHDVGATHALVVDLAALTGPAAVTRIALEAHAATPPPT